MQAIGRGSDQPRLVALLSASVTLLLVFSTALEALQASEQHINQIVLC